MAYKDDGMLRTVEDVIEMMELAESDVVADFGQEAWDTGGGHDVLTGQLDNCTTAEARDFLQRQL